VEHGPCEHHRRSFAPVREAFERRGVHVELPAGMQVIAVPEVDIELDAALLAAFDDDANVEGNGNGVAAG
jgi:ribonuclease HII